MKRATTSSQVHTAAEVTEAMGRYLDGDERAFRQVYAALAPVVRRCHARWSGAQSADDLTQQTFLRVHRARESYRRDSAVGPWVLAIARRLSIDALRSRGRAFESLTREGELPPVGVSPAVEARAVAAAVRAAVEALPENQRAVVELHRFEDQSFAEVAATLGIQETAARVRAHRAYAALRGLLGAFAPSAA